MLPYICCRAQVFRLACPSSKLRTCKFQGPNMWLWLVESSTYRVQKRVEPVWDRTFQILHIVTLKFPLWLPIWHQQKNSCFTEYSWRKWVRGLELEVSILGVKADLSWSMGIDDVAHSSAICYVCTLGVKAYLNSFYKGQNWDTLRHIFWVVHSSSCPWSCPHQKPQKRLNLWKKAQRNWCRTTRHWWRTGLPSPCRNARCVVSLLSL